MKYIIIPLFRFLSLPGLGMFYIFLFTWYLLICLWDFKFKNLFKSFYRDTNISFSKNKPLYISYNVYTYDREYSYKTLFNYIINKKSE